MKIALAVLMALTPVSAVADEYQRGYSASRTCYKSEYREEYVPGTADNPGYIKSWNETVEVPCRGRRTHSGPTIHQSHGLWDQSQFSHTSLRNLKTQNGRCER